MKEKTKMTKEEIRQNIKILAARIISCIDIKSVAMRIALLVNEDPKPYEHSELECEEIVVKHVFELIEPFWTKKEKDGMFCNSLEHKAMQVNIMVFKNSVYMQLSWMIGNMVVISYSADSSDNESASKKAEGLLERAKL